MENQGGQEEGPIEEIHNISKLGDAYMFWHSCLCNSGQVFIIFGKAIVQHLGIQLQLMYTNTKTMDFVHIIM